MHLPDRELILPLKEGGFVGNLCTHKANIHIAAVTEKCPFIRGSEVPFISRNMAGYAYYNCRATHVFTVGS